MATLTATLAAVTSILQPLVPATLAAVVNGPREQLNESPAAWVWFGPTSVAHDTDGTTTWERHVTRTGRVTVYANRSGLLPGAYAALVAPVDAVMDALNAEPTRSGVWDRFEVTGVGEPGMDEQLGMIAVDVQWAALWIEANTYLNDWG